MNSKSNTNLAITFTCFLYLAQQQCQAQTRQLYRTQENLVGKARERIRTDTQVVDKIERETLFYAKDAIAKAANQPNSPLVPVRNRIDRVLNANQVSPEEIASIKADLDKAAAQPNFGIDQTEYKRLTQRLDIAHGMATTIGEIQQGFESTIGKLDENFNALAAETDRIKSSANRFLTWLVGSVSVNLCAIIGFVAQVPTMRLERRLKKLEIVEKVVKFEKDRIDPKKYT